MIVYFVRHGVTEHNKRAVHQSPDVPLSEEGKLQMRRVAAALRDKSVSAIISSDLPRTKSSAEVVGRELGLPVGESELLREIRRPSSLFGKSHYHPKTVAYVLSMLLHKNQEGWRYEDAESLTDIHKRADEAGDMLGGFAAEHASIAVVSHAIFLEILIANLSTDGVLKFTDYLPIFSPFSVIKNASISTFEYHGATGENLCAWEQRTFNDTSHL